MEFYESIAEYYEDIFPLKSVKRDFIVNSLNNLDTGRLLDIGCATGELSEALAFSNAVLHIDAIDLDEKMIDIALAKQKNHKIRFRVMDMTEILAEYSADSFDAVICFGNTLVHLQDTEQISDFLADIKKVLRPTGVFLMQILNYRHILDNNINELPVIDNELIRFERKYENSGNSLSFLTKLDIKNSGHSINNRIPLYPLTKTELHNALIAAGFKSIKYFASFDEKPYTGNHLPLVVLAH